MRSSARTQLLASGLLVIVFAVGGLVGAATDRVLAAREPLRPAPAVAEKPVEKREGRSHGAMIDAHMLDEISLSARQRVVIDSILDVHEREAKKLWKEEWEPRFNAMMKETRGQVRAQLTPEQKQQLDQLIEQWRLQRKQNKSAPQQPGQPGAPGPEKHRYPPDNDEPAPRRLFESTIATT